MFIDERQIRQAARWVEEAQALLITAGAGMGVDSGLPDFRGPEGLWRAYPALRQSHMSFQEIASPSAFATRPELAWGFYGHRLALYRATQPHAGFDILRRWAGRAPAGARVFTSNVDGQFQKAGFAPGEVHECHGSLHLLQCQQPCRAVTWPADTFKPEFPDPDQLRLATMPSCPHCGALARPNVLMFNDWAWVDEPTQDSALRLRGWLHRHKHDLLVIEIGAGTAIPTARRFGERHASRLIRINAYDAGVAGTADQLGIEGAALDVLSRIENVLHGSGAI